MRTLSAFVLGVVVTIGGAYVHDTTVALPTDKPLVNWDQFSIVTHSAIEGVRNQWNRLTK
jgi:predicted membrane-bound mannosyltransferase